MAYTDLRNRRNRECRGQQEGRLAEELGMLILHHDFLSKTGSNLIPKLISVDWLPRQIG